MLALEQAAAAGRIGETAQIAAGLMQPVTLGWVAPQDSARVLAALQQAGLDDTATTLADELIRSYLLRIISPLMRAEAGMAEQRQRRDAEQNDNG